MDAHKTPDAVREAVIAAITKADANFGYSYCLTKMDEAGEEHTLFMDGFEPAVFQDREDGYPVIEQRRNAARTDAILAALDSRAGDAGEEIENGYTADDAVDFVFNRLAGKLGLADWQVVEGSEEWEGDVSATLHRLLVDARILDDETGAVATLATPAPAVDAKARTDMAAALRNTPAEALREAGYLERAAQMIEAPAVGAVPVGEVEANDQHLIGLLRREAAHSGVWFADQLALAADRLAALSHGEGRK